MSTAAKELLESFKSVTSEISLRLELEFLDGTSFLSLGLADCTNDEEAAHYLEACGHDLALAVDLYLTRPTPAAPRAPTSNPAARKTDGVRRRRVPPASSHAASASTESRRVRGGEKATLGHGERRASRQQPSTSGVVAALPDDDDDDV
jgi:hypothetical protein